MNKYKRFLNDESGAITVDWVVLTASIVGIAIAVLIIIASGLQSASTGVNGNLENTGSASDQIAAAVGTTAGNNGGLPGNLSDYANDGAHNGHEHYIDEATETRYRVEPDGGMYDPTNTQVATVDGDGVVTAL